MSAQEPIKQNRVGFKRNAEGTFDPYLGGGIPAIVGGVVQTAPRVTIEQIEAEIKHEFYFTAGDGVHGSVLATGQDQSSYPDTLDRTLFCVLVLKNGMRVEGVSHSISEASTMPLEVVKQNTRKKAIDKLWPMFGFELAQKLYREKQAG